MVKKAVKPAKKKLDRAGLLADAGVHVPLQGPLCVEQQAVGREPG